MGRSANTKNTNAGTIDSAVNASTAAVSCEYCDWKVATPSGRVKSDSSLNTSNGSRYWFQLVTKASTVTVTSAAPLALDEVRRALDEAGYDLAGER